MSQATEDNTTPTELRSKIERAVEGLLAILDGLDATDDDREPNGDELDDEADAEPVLGSVDNFTNQTRWGAGGVDDAEGDEHDGAEPDQEGEPSLGSTSSHNQVEWAGGGTEEREDEHDGAEPDGDDEPSLGSFDRMADQSKSWRQHHGPSAGWGYCLDAEQDDSGREDNGDRDALATRRTMMAT